MLRWLFLLLLLANTVVLLWAALVRPDRVSEVIEPLPREGVELRLLSELAPSALQRLEQVPDPATQGLCLVYEGFADGSGARQAARLMRSNGFEPQLLTERRSEPEGFEILLSVPTDTNARIALIERLEALDVVPESRPGEAVLLLGRYRDLAVASEAMARFAEAGLEPEMRERERLVEHFKLLLPAVSDRNLFNKINRVLEKAHPSIKIEKKVCEGVASPGGDQ
ncbi:hypothetical protein [Marinobacterium aestuariivivens]|uniref:SPOR domain-containing protein n=1 Tax=Marinobacterium aestuariivivens TaxID=1698799 RepID=A0ABW2A0B0_9GAMM